MTNPASPSPSISGATVSPTNDAAHAALRVAIFSDSLPERNGAGAYYEDLSAQLRSEVQLLELFQPLQKSRALRLALPLPGDRTQKLILPNVPRLWRQFNALQPDVVVAVTPGPFGLLGLILARRARCGFLTGFHTHFEEVAKLYGKPLFCRIANRYLVTVNRVLCRHSDAVMVNNETLVPIVKGLGAPRVEIMGTPVPVSFLAKPVGDAPKSLRSVLFAGRLAPEKNLPSIIQAAQALPNLQFVIAGDGPLRKSLERQTRNLPNVRMTGWLDREALRLEMDATSLLLLPSHLETFGTVALEAMARGRPALVAENAGIHCWTVLRQALFVLHQGETLTDALIRLQKMPVGGWAEKAAGARGAAETLNRDTVQQWAGYVSRYARRRDDRD